MVCDTYLGIRFFNVVLNKCNTNSGRRPVQLTVDGIRSRLDDPEVKSSGSEMEDSGDDAHEPYQCGDDRNNDEDSGSSGENSDDDEYDERRPCHSSAQPGK